MHHIKPKDLFPKANKRIQMIYTKSLKPKVSNERGAFQYQKAKPKRIDLKIEIGSGRYLGDQNQIYAFIWDEPMTNQASVVRAISVGDYK